HGKRPQYRFHTSELSQRVRCTNGVQSVYGSRPINDMGQYQLKQWLCAGTDSSRLRPGAIFSDWNDCSLRSGKFRRSDRVASRAIRAKKLSELQLGREGGLQVAS